MNSPNRKNLNTFLFVFHIFQYSLLKPVLVTIDQSQVLLASITLLLVFTSLIFNHGRMSKSWVLFITFSMILLLIDLGLRTNSYSYEMFYNYLAFCITPTFLFSYVKDFKKVLTFISYFSVIVYIIYVFEPFTNYFITGDYMSLGQVIVPTFIGMHLGRKILKMNWVILFELLCSIEIILFTNKGSILAVLTTVLLTQIILKGKKLLYSFKTFSIILISLLVFINFKQILQLLIQMLNKYELSGYSLNSLSNALEGDIKDALTGRDAIWAEALEVFASNPFFGSGMGIFQHKTGIFTHNILTDLLVQFGLAGFFIAGLLIFSGFYSIYKFEKNYHRVVGMMLILMCFPKLFFSSIFFTEPSFWILLFIGFNGLLNMNQDVSYY